MSTNPFFDSNLYTMNQSLRDIKINLPTASLHKKECFSQTSSTSFSHHHSDDYSDSSYSDSHHHSDSCSHSHYHSDSDDYSDSCSHSHDYSSSDDSCSIKTSVRSCSEIDSKIRSIVCYPPRRGCCYNIIYYPINPWDYFVGRFCGIW